MLTDFIWVSYDGRDSADVYISHEYFGKTCGLCGTFDDDKSSDMTLPNGELVSQQYIPHTDAGRWAMET